MAHPISVTRTLVFVSRDEVMARVDGYLEDVFLFHDLKPNEQGILEPDEIMRGIELHKEFIAKKFRIRDAAGELLNVKEVRLKEISPLGNGVGLEELMAYTTKFELRYHLPSSPEYLTFTQHFTDETDILPAEMTLEVKQENAGKPSSTLLMPDRPETVRFNWENPALSEEASVEEWKKWAEEQRHETLGITSYGSVYSFLYIEDHEVRHEILVPLATLEESLTLERNDDEFLDLAEQDAARPEIESHFLSGNPIEVDGIEVTGKVEWMNFYGVDFKDFALQAPRKRVSMGSARVGLILSYPTSAPPETVKLTWDRFSYYLWRVNLAVLAYDETLSATLRRVGPDKAFEWKNPGRSLPASPEEVGAVLPPEKMLSLPVLSLGCFLLGAVVVLALQRHGKPAKQRYAVLAGLLLVAVLGWPFLRWDVADPFRRQAEIPAEEADDVFAKMLQNVYRSFHFREEGSLYDALAQSVHGDLLSDFYLEIRRGLVMEEQGGAVSRVSEVVILNGERAPLPEASNDQDRSPGSFGYRSQWSVAGTVEHWGHLHERTNQYSAVFAVEPIDGAWKITGMEILDETRLRAETRLRSID